MSGESDPNTAGQSLMLPRHNRKSETTKTMRHERNHSNIKDRECSDNDAQGTYTVCELYAGIASMSTVLQDMGWNVTHLVELKTEIRTCLTRGTISKGENR
jgi:hypothetical protein